MVKYSSFKDRSYAFLIDMVFIAGLSFILGLVLSTFCVFVPLMSYNFFKTGLSIFFILIFVWLYFALLESSSKQATVGKMIMGLKVTDLKYKRLSFMHASKRFFFKILSFNVALNNKGQAYHDILSGSYVIKE